MVNPEVAEDFEETAHVDAEEAADFEKAGTGRFR